MADSASTHRRQAERLIAVASGKGGVGKSTIAASVALELRRRGNRVGLLDTDIFGPSLPALFQLYDAQLGVDSDEQIIPIVAHGLQLVSFGFILGDAPAIMRGPMVTRYIEQLLHDVAWPPLDWLVLDLPPGTGDIQLTLTQQLKLDGALIVTTPQALAYADVGKALLMFERVQVPTLGLVENMAWFDCPSCGTRHAPFGGNSAELLSRRFGLPIIGRLPLSPSRYGLADSSGVAALTRAAVRPDSNTIELVDSMLERMAELPALAPPSVETDNTYIHLTWQDGNTLSVRHYDLRANCHCALCVDEHSGRTRPDLTTIPADVRATEIRPLGNYALYIAWSDRHTTGFFPYRLIRRLASRL